MNYPLLKINYYPGESKDGYIQMLQDLVDCLDNYSTGEGYSLSNVFNLYIDLNVDISLWMNCLRSMNMDADLKLSQNIFRDPIIQGDFFTLLNTRLTKTSSSEAYTLTDWCYKFITETILVLQTSDFDKYKNLDKIGFYLWSSLAKLRKICQLEELDQYFWGTTKYFNYIISQLQKAGFTNHGLYFEPYLKYKNQMIPRFFITEQLTPYNIAICDKIEQLNPHTMNRLFVSLVRIRFLRVVTSVYIDQCNTYGNNESFVEASKYLSDFYQTPISMTITRSMLQNGLETLLADTNAVGSLISLGISVLQAIGEGLEGERLKNYLRLFHVSVETQTMIKQIAQSLYHDTVSLLQGYNHDFSIDENNEFFDILLYTLAAKSSSA